MLTEVPVVASTAERSYTADTSWMPAGGEALDGAIVTFTSPATLFGAKVSVAAASGVVIVPPSVAEINVGGGESPLAVFAFGSGIVVGAGVGAAVELSGATVSVLLVPTRTLTAPVPGTVVVAGAEETAFGSGWRRGRRRGRHRQRTPIRNCDRRDGHSRRIFVGRKRRVADCRAGRLRACHIQAGHDRNRLCRHPAKGRGGPRSFGPHQCRHRRRDDRAADRGHTERGELERRRSELAKRRDRRTAGA